MDTKEKINVMQAASMGKPVQWTVDGKGWIDCTNEPGWNWAAYNYRIKPAPREWCLYRNQATGAIAGFSPWNDALLGQGIRVREVLPE